MSSAKVLCPAQRSILVYCGRLSCSAVQLAKTPRPTCPHSHSQLMLSSRAPQNHKLNFKCKTPKERFILVLPCHLHGHIQVRVINSFHPERSGTLFFDSLAFLAGRV